MGALQLTSQSFPWPHLPLKLDALVGEELFVVRGDLGREQALHQVLFGKDDRDVLVPGRDGGGAFHADVAAADDADLLGGGEGGDLPSAPRNDRLDVGLEALLPSFLVFMSALTRLTSLSASCTFLT